MDERENLPSISQFEAMSLCPARWQMCQQVPEPPPSPDAQYGTQVARARETGDVEDLSDEQRELVEEMKEQEAALLKEIFGKGMMAASYREKRFWYLSPRMTGATMPGLRKLFSGKLDFSAWAHSQERVAVYFDDKALWGETTPPAHNMQLRGGAVLLKQSFGSRRVFVAILQPTKRKFAIAAEYGPEELEQAEQECVKLVERATGLHHSGAPTPGPEQCRYCRAKLICKVAHREVLRLDHMSETVFGPTIQDLTDLTLDRLGKAWETAQIIGKAIDAEIKRRKEADPDSMPNYLWRDNGRMPEMPPPHLAWPHFGHLLTSEEFSNACRLSKTAITEAVHKKTGMTVKDSKKTVEKLLDKLITWKAKARSLVRRPYYEIKS